MERIKSRGSDGKQTVEYASSYYANNSERIAIRARQRHGRIKADPVLLQEHRKKSVEATHRWRERHPEQVKLSARRTKNARRVRVFNLLGGAVCRNCGCDELAFLELNHKNGGGCQEFKQVGNHLYELILQGKRNPQDYEVLCRVCNALDHLQRRNPEVAKYYQVNFTGKRAERIDG